jgi:uncharacterized protein with HEPN domain
LKHFHIFGSFFILFFSKIEKGISTITESGKHFVFFLNKKVMKTEVRDIKVGGEVLREAKQRFRAQKPEMPLTNSLLKTKRPLDFEESAVS